MRYSYTFITLAVLAGSQFVVAAPLAATKTADLASAGKYF